MLFGINEAIELNVALVPTAPLLAHDILVTSNYDLPSASDDRLYANITNLSDATIEGTISLYRWEWTRTARDNASRSSTPIIIAPSQTLSYYDSLHGNTEYGDIIMWLAFNGTPISRDINILPGYHLSTADPEVEVIAYKVGVDYAIARYAQWGTCDHWEYHLFEGERATGIYEEVASYAYAAADWAYCAYWLLEGLKGSTLYEVDCYGYQIGGAHRSDWTLFTTQ